MFSVIIPTIWKGKELKIQLPELLIHPLIGEVIIIDNNITKTPYWFKNLSFGIDNAKLQYLPQNQNIYVDPAWNLGVKVAKNEQLCILSDDVLFDPKIFNIVNGQLEKGIIGLNPVDILINSDNSSELQSQSQSQSPKLVMTMEETAPLGYVMLFWIAKSQWIPIPDGFKIHNGEQWIYSTQLLNGKIPRVLQHFHVITTPYSSTMNAFDDIRKQDDEFYKNKFPELLHQWYHQQTGKSYQSFSEYIQEYYIKAAQLGEPIISACDQNKNLTQYSISRLIEYIELVQRYNMN